MSCLTSSFCFCACWYNLCFFPKCAIEKVLLLSLGPSKMQWKVLDWLGGVCSSLNCWPGMGPCFPTHCHQFSRPSLEKKHSIISSHWDIPSSPRSSGVSRPCWSHTEIAMCEVKSCRCLFSNVLLVQSEQCWEDTKALCSRSKVDFCAFSQDSLCG